METLQGTISGMVGNAVQHYRNRLEDEQVNHTDMFHGVRRSYGEVGDLRSVAGRSSSVSTDIRDAVLHVLPKVLEALLGPSRVVRFTPTSPTDVQNADLQTDMVRHVITQDNKGFLQLYNAIFDSLVRDMGWVKYRWAEGGMAKSMTYRGLAEPQAVAAVTQAGVTGYDVIQGPYQSQHTGEEVWDCVVQFGQPGKVMAGVCAQRRDRVQPARPVHPGG